MMLNVPNPKGWLPASLFYVKSFINNKPGVDRKFTLLTMTYFNSLQLGPGWLHAYQHAYVINVFAEPAVLRQIITAPMS